MSKSVTGKLNKPAHEFAAGDSIGFGITIGEQNYNRKTKAKEWTNYKVVVFAKAAQADFYRQSLIAGAIVSASGTGLLIDRFQGQQGEMITLELCDAKITYVAQSESKTGSPAHGAYDKAMAPGGAAHSPPAGFDDLDSIPF